MRQNQMLDIILQIYIQNYHSLLTASDLLSVSLSRMSRAVT